MCLKTLFPDVCALLDQANSTIFPFSLLSSCRLYSREGKKAALL